MTKFQFNYIIYIIFVSLVKVLSEFIYFIFDYMLKTHPCNDLMGQKWSIISLFFLFLINFFENLSSACSLKRAAQWFRALRSYEMEI